MPKTTPTPDMSNQYDYEEGVYEEGEEREDPSLLQLQAVFCDPCKAKVAIFYQ